jgi:hypothetical protein
MTEPMTVMAMAGFGLAGLGISLLAALKGWQGWLELKRLELTAAADARGAERPHGGAGDMIEVADLKERIRKLESIAACVDL